MIRDKFISKGKREKIKSIISKLKRSNNTYSLKKVCFYYGVPALLNDINEINEVVKIYSKYDIVVFGDEYQLESNEYYESTKQLIRNLRELNSELEIFGYVPCAAENGGKNLDIDDIKLLIDKWNKLGVTGIFYDEFGYDYGNTRKRQNTLISYGKEYGLNAFVNSWRDDYVFSSEPMVLDWMGNFEPNPNRIEPIIDKNDYALYENLFWGVNANTQVGSNTESLYRAYEYFNVAKDEYQMTYHKRFGTRIISLDGIYSKLEKDKKNELMSISCLGSILLNIDGVAFGNENWGSDGYFEEFILPDMEVINSIEKHDVRCIYDEYARGYKCNLNGYKFELTWDVNPKVETIIEDGIRKIKLNESEIVDCYNLC